MYGLGSLDSTFLGVTVYREKEYPFLIGFRSPSLFECNCYDYCPVHTIESGY